MTNADSCGERKAPAAKYKHCLGSEWNSVYLCYKSFKVLTVIYDGYACKLSFVMTKSHGPNGSAMVMPFGHNSANGWEVIGWKGA